MLEEREPLEGLSEGWSVRRMTHSRVILGDAWNVFRTRLRQWRALATDGAPAPGRWVMVVVRSIFLF